MNHSLLAAHTAERLRDSLRETSDHVRNVVLGTAVWSLYAFANFSGLGKSSRERRNRRLADRRPRRPAAAPAEQSRARVQSMAS